MTEWKNPSMAIIEMCDHSHHRTLSEIFDDIPDRFFIGVEDCWWPCDVTCHCRAKIYSTAYLCSYHSQVLFPKTEDNYVRTCDSSHMYLWRIHFFSHNIPTPSTNHNTVPTSWPLSSWCLIAAWATDDNIDGARKAGASSVQVHGRPNNVSRCPPSSPTKIQPPPLSHHRAIFSQWRQRSRWYRRLSLLEVRCDRACPDIAACVAVRRKELQLLRTVVTRRGVAVWKCRGA